MMIAGELPPGSRVSSVGGASIVVAFLTPWLIMGGGLTLVGVLAIGPRRTDAAELWICLPAGVALLAGVGFMAYWHFWRVPRQTIAKFEFDGAVLSYHNHRDGAVTLRVAELRSFIEQRGRRSYRLRGWWLKIDGRGWVYLDRYTSNAEELVRQLASHVGPVHS